MPVTITVTVQELSAGIAPPVRVTVEPPIGAVTVPPQVLLALPATVKPLGSISTSGAVNVAIERFGLLRLIVRVELPPAVTEIGLKDLLSVGGTAGIGVTTKVATAGAVLLPLLVCKAPAAIELKKLPEPGAVTSTVTVQEPLAGIEPPVSVTVEPPLGAVTDPPHVVLGAPETVTPLGNVSISGAVRSASTLFWLLRLSTRLVVPPAMIEAGVNDLFSVGATAATGVTVKVAAAGTVLLPLLVCKAPVASELM